MLYYTNVHGMPCMQSLLCVATLGDPERVQVIASNRHSGSGQEPEYRFLLAQRLPLHIVPELIGGMPIPTRTSSFPSSQPVTIFNAVLVHCTPISNRCQKSSS